MKEILDTQWFQLRKDKAFLFLFLATILACFIVTIPLTAVDETNIVFSAGIFIITTESISAIIVAILVLILVGYVMGKDFSDKTICYEMQFGHSRDAIFFGRVIVATIVSLVATLILMVGPVLYFQGKNGFGDYISVKSFVFRLVVFLIVAIRLVFEIVLISVITKKIYLTYVVGLIIGMLEMEISPFVEFPYVTYFNAAMSVFEYETSAKSHLDKTLEITVVESLNNSVSVSVILFSVLIGGVCLLAARTYFKNDDI